MTESKLNFTDALASIEKTRQEFARDFTRLAQAVADAQQLFLAGEHTAALGRLETAGDLEYNLLADMPATAPLLGRLRLLAAIPLLREAGYHPIDYDDHLIVVHKHTEACADAISETLGLEHYEVSTIGGTVKIEA